MMRAENLLPRERQRLEQCPKEPIHAPGSVQRHGVLLSLDSETLECRQVSANIGEILARQPESVLGAPLEDTFGAQPARTLREALASPRMDRLNPLRLSLATPSGAVQVDALLHRSDDVLVVELEPRGASDDGRELASLLAGFHEALLRLPPAGGQELYDHAVREIRRLTGYDRVMAYRFHEDGHGEVVGEDRRQGLQSFLGLHYPASDIPAQARHLYRLRHSRLIVDAAAEPSKLVPERDPRSARPLDMSLSALRAVPAKHVQFLQNMGVRGSLSISLVNGGALWGMISCTHRSPRFIPYNVRRAAEAIGHVVTIRHVGHESTAALCKRLTLQSVRSRLGTQMATSHTISAALTESETTLLDLVEADGAVVSCQGTRSSVGNTPNPDEANALIRRIRRTPSSEGFVTEALSVEHPELAALAPEVAGVLVIPLTGSKGYLAWFRAEVVRTVSWLGDDGNRGIGAYDPLSPRNSFETWKQTVAGRSLSWDATEVAAANSLGRDVEEIIGRRAQAHLAHYALHDALTGLPNRLLLLDRLQNAVERAGRGQPSELLFIDLDGFKAVNDSAGHAAGDAVLREVATRVGDAIRGVDTAARYGGDEFVVLCETAIEDVHVLVERLTTVIHEPVHFAGHTFELGASIGVTRVQPGRSAQDLLREADAAMYRNKRKRRTDQD